PAVVQDRSTSYTLGAVWPRALATCRDRGAHASAGTICRVAPAQAPSATQVSYRCAGELRCNPGSIFVPPALFLLHSPSRGTAGPERPGRISTFARRVRCALV